MGRLVSALCVAIAASVCVLAAPQALPTPTELAGQIQARYATIKSFTANFTQIDTPAHVPQTRTQRGTVKVLKPGCMWWHYEAPEKMEIVSNGTTLLTYSKADNSGTRSKMPSGTDRSTAVLFLFGEGNLVRDFTPALPASQPAAEWHLDLHPKSKQADFDLLTLVVERQTLRMTGFTTIDSEGDQHDFRFADLKENATLSLKDFKFEFPPHADVQDR